MTHRIRLLLVASLVLPAAAACSDDGGEAPAAATDTFTDTAEDTSAAADTETDPDTGPDTAADAGEQDTYKPPPTWTESKAFEPHRPYACPAKVGADDRYGELLAKLQCVTGFADNKPEFSACSRQNVRIPKTLYDQLGGNLAKDPNRLAHFHPLQEDFAGRGACYGANLSAALDHADDADHPLTRTIAEASAAIGVPIEVGGLFVVPDPDAPLVEAIRALHIIAGGEFKEAEVKAAAQQVPVSVQVAVAKVLLGALAAIPMRDDWLADAGYPKRYNPWFKQGTGLWIPQQGGGIDPDSALDAAVFRLSDGYDKLFGGAGRLAQAIDEAGFETLAGSDDAGKEFAFVADTPYGKVVIRGGGKDTYDPGQGLAGDLLLVLDTGGDDTYLIAAGANTSYKNPASVLIDLGGDDSYGYAEKKPPAAEGLLPDDGGGRLKFQEWLVPASLSKNNRQGAGRLGYGFLVDLGGGADTYTSLRMSQGWCNFGVGLLWDDGGDDTYTAEAASQGAAYVGIAILHDGGGKDTYRAFWNAQGFAWVSSYGALYDRDGDDAYECVVKEPLVYDSPQTPKSANASLCQGTAFGWRRDKTKTHRSGGIALLRDRAGNDSYLGSTFTQGTGYWLGTGILADGAGDDRYDGLFYAQGAAAHYAIGILLEGAGNDRFNAGVKGVPGPINCTTGCAHDFSSALLVDEAGDDVYKGRSRAIGASKCHGHGIFVDNGGADSYATTENKSIGWATDYDGNPGTCGDYKYLPSYGFFVDVGGKDSYDKPDSTGYGDGKTWITDDPGDKDALELSGGIDAAGGGSYMRVK